MDFDTALARYDSILEARDNRNRPLEDLFDDPDVDEDEDLESDDEDYDEVLDDEEEDD